MNYLHWQVHSWNIDDMIMVSWISQQEALNLFPRLPSSCSSHRGCGAAAEKASGSWRDRWWGPSPSVPPTADTATHYFAPNTLAPVAGQPRLLAGLSGYAHHGAGLPRRSCVHPHRARARCVRRRPLVTLPRATAAAVTHHQATPDVRRRHYHHLVLLWHAHLLAPHCRRSRCCFLLTVFTSSAASSTSLSPPFLTLKALPGSAPDLQPPAGPLSALICPLQPLCHNSL